MAELMPSVPDCCSLLAAAIPESDFWRVFNAVEGQDRVLLMTLLHLGARKGEIFRLRWEDISFNDMTITLYTRKRKGGNLEPDMVPMTYSLKAELLWWWGTSPGKDGPCLRQPRRVPRSG